MYFKNTCNPLCYNIHRLTVKGIAMIDLNEPNISAARCRQGLEQERELFIPEDDDVAILIHDYQVALDNRCRERDWEPDREHDQVLSKQLANRAQALGFNTKSYF